MSSLHDIWDFSVIGMYAKFYSSFGCYDLRAYDIPPFQTSWLSQRLVITETFRLSAVVWKLFGHVDISDESDADDRIGEVARSPKTLA